MSAASLVLGSTLWACDLGSNEATGDTSIESDADARADASESPGNSGACTPMPFPEGEYCFEGRAGYTQRVVRGDVCEEFAPSREIPSVCDARGPVTTWQPVWEPAGTTIPLDIACNVGDACPVVVRQRSLTTTETERGGRFQVGLHFVLKNGATLTTLNYSPTSAGGQSADPRLYKRLAAVSPDLELLWQSPDVTHIDNVVPTEDGDLLLTAQQSSGPHPILGIGERPTRYYDNFLARLDQDTGTPQWVAHLTLPYFAAQGLRGGSLAATTTVFCDPGEGGIGGFMASAALDIDLQTGDVTNCRVIADTLDSAIGPHWVGDSAIYNTYLVDLQQGVRNRALSTLSPTGVPTELVNSVAATAHFDSIRLADGSTVFLLGEWFRLNEQAELVARTPRPFGTPGDRSLARFLPLIGYNDRSVLAGSSSSLNLVSTRSLFEGTIDRSTQSVVSGTYTGIGGIFAMQDGTWLAYGGLSVHLVDGDGNVLWEIRSSDPEQANLVTGTPIDDEHILVIFDRSGNTLGTERGDLVDFYIIRHVHGGVANTQNATHGYDIYDSWIPPEDPVLDGPEIEPRWTLAE